jgi:hypothetical protein
MSLQNRIIFLVAIFALGFSQLSFAQTTMPQSSPPKEAQKPATAPAPTAAQMPKTSTQNAQATMPTGSAQQSRQRIVIVEPIRVFDPFFDYPYPYAYPPDYMAENFGYIKLKTDLKDASVYVDGGFADKIEKTKKFALRPGNHDIEMRDSDGRTLFRERVQVIVGKTTELHVG